MEIDLTLILILILTGFTAGLVDAIAGGGGLISLPVLLATGMNPVQALATNKLQGSFGCLAAAHYFVRKKMVDLKQMKLMIACTFCGAATGSVMVQYIDAGLLVRFMPLLLVLIALYFLFSNRVSDEDSQRRISNGVLAFVFTTLLGFYDGFFGPGAGAFFNIVFVSLAGFSLIKAGAHSRVLNLTSNLAALIFFAMGGHILWAVGFIMALGQFVGGRVGASLAIKKGTRLIRPMIVGVTLVMSGKLLVDQYDFNSALKLMAGII